MAVYLAKRLPVHLGPAGTWHQSRADLVYPAVVWGLTRRMSAFGSERADESIAGSARNGTFAVGVRVVLGEFVLPWIILPRLRGRRQQLSSAYLL